MIIFLRGVEVVIEAVYVWLRQVVVFYIISTLLVNAVIADKYKDYIRIVTRMILILIVISPVARLYGNENIIKDKLDMVYKEYLQMNKKTDDISEDFSYTVEDALTQTLEFKVKEVLNENNISAGHIDVNIDRKADLSSSDESVVLSLVINAKNLKKSDIEKIRHEISDETGIEIGKIYIK